MKYDVPLNIQERNSLSILLEYIAPGSMVLEFGCANGRMTKYMKENLGCKVYIVEYDADAFNDAIKFAEDGMCTDIMTYEWKTAFSCMFDYVIFADVLEHLRDPENVLLEVSSILKEDGKLLVSIPNIAHNDIIIKLLDDHFDYTDIGLLDDTHIHFWGANNIEKFFEKSGYFIDDIQYTVIPMGCTEQFRNSDPQINNMLKNFLALRKYGDVYQFIICARKKNVHITKFSNINIVKKNSIESKIYYDLGQGFNEDNTILVNAVASEQGTWKIEGKIVLPQKAQRVRFDLVEGQSCILLKNNIFVENEKIQINYSRNLMTKKGMLLVGTDPLYEVLVPQKELHDLVCEIEFSLADDKYVELLIDNLLKKQEDITELKSEHTKLKNQLVLYEHEKEEISNRLNQCEHEKEEISNRLNQCEHEKEGISNRLNLCEHIKEEILNKLSVCEAEKEKILEKLEGCQEHLVCEKNYSDDIEAVLKMRIRELDELLQSTQMDHEELSILRSDVITLRREYELKDARIKKMESTISWRITRGLRKVGKLLGK